MATDIYTQTTVLIIRMVQGVLAVFGNSLVIICVLKFKNLQKLSHLFIVYLSIIDGLQGLTLLVFQPVVDLSDKYSLMYPHLCRVKHGLTYFAGTSELCSMLLISIDRYLNMRAVLNSQCRKLSKPLAIIMLVVSNIYAIGKTLLVMVFSKLPENLRNTGCLSRKFFERWVSIEGFSFLAFVTVSIIFCYARIIQWALKAKRRIFNTTATKRSTPLAVATSSGWLATKDYGNHHKTINVRSTGAKVEDEERISKGTSGKEVVPGEVITGGVITKETNMSLQVPTLGGEKGDAITPALPAIPFFPVQERKKQNYLHLRMVKTLGLVVGVYFSLYLAAICSNVIVRYFPNFAVIYHIFGNIYLMNFWINPLIFAIRIKEFRQAYLSLLSRAGKLICCR